MRGVDAASIGRMSKHESCCSKSPILHILNMLQLLGGADVRPQPELHYFAQEKYPTQYSRPFERVEGIGLAGAILSKTLAASEDKTSRRREFS